MGNYICRYVLSPEVTTDDVESLACYVRAYEKAPATFTLCDLENKNLRKPAFKLARDHGVRIIEIDTRLHSRSLIAAADSVFGDGRYLYREADDDEIAIIHPNALWLKNTFGTDGLAWLLNVFADIAPWNTQNFYALPGNPPDSSCSIPIHAKLLKPVKPGQPRECPMCGNVYVSKFPRAQCRDPECHFGTIPFETAKEAFSIAKVHVDDTGWGRCPRCQREKTFSNLIEQCFTCGQLMEADGQYIARLVDNRERAQSLISRIQRQHSSRWWKFWGW